MNEHPTGPAAIREQLEALHGASFAWALACCADRSTEAEDVLQMTYLKILDGRVRFEGRAAFKTWLFGVIRMTAREQRRRAWRGWLRSVHVDEAEKLHANETAPDDAAARSEASERVRAACARLPERQREVMMLVFHQDLALDEAAVVMGVSPGSARKHYQRGKEHLRALLGDLLSRP